MEFLEFKNKIINEFSERIGIELLENQCHSFFDYMNLLIEKNKVMNLTTIVEPDEIILRHFVDSAILVKIFGVEIFEGKKIVDVGTGAGFPGLPLAIVCPNAKFVLTDTLGKRIGFLSEVLSKINIKNVELVKSRAEDFAHDKKYRESFDYCVTRGVAKLSVLSEYTLPLLKVEGKSLAYKLFDCDEEVDDSKNAIKILGGMFHVKHSYDLMLDEPKRCVIEIEKTKPTPKQYPRKAGTPSKKPL